MRVESRIVGSWGWVRSGRLGRELHTAFAALLVEEEAEGVRLQLVKSEVLSVAMCTDFRPRRMRCEGICPSWWRPVSVPGQARQGRELRTAFAALVEE